MNKHAVKFDQEFFGAVNPQQLLQDFGSPLYVYQEKILRQNCRDMQSLINGAVYQANYSAKANTNLHLLSIICEEGLYADAMSPGEIIALEKAGFSPEKIFFVPNNVSADELLFAAERGILTSFDSLDQLDLMGRLAPGSRVAIRINPGVGAGHHEKVVTAGDKTKFGINRDQLKGALKLADTYQLKIVGVNQHIGSLFMEAQPYLEAAGHFLEMAELFPDLELVDFGGGFGIPYHKLEAQTRLDLEALSKGLSSLAQTFTRKIKKPIQFKSEPGRYIVAEAGVLLGTVHACKTNDQTHYAGTDLGFNVLIRPMVYDAWHDLLAYRDGKLLDDQESQTVTVVGNICESGDIIARDRDLPPLRPGDAIAVLDAGAYGYAMSSNYNHRLRPAEVLLRQDGSIKLIRRRDTYEDLFSGTPDLDS